MTKWNLIHIQAQIIDKLVKTRRTNSKLGARFKICFSRVVATKFAQTGFTQKKLYYHYGNKPYSSTYTWIC